MMNYVFAGMIIVSFFSAVLSGNSSGLAQGVIDGASESIELLITMAGMLALWSGIMEIASRGGFMMIMGRALSPVLSRLFKGAPKGSAALEKISMNVSANLLGLGNAATPFGISAMRELQAMNPEHERASDDMITFVLINTASIQLMPTMIGTLRQSMGSEEPFSVLPCIWISSACALLVGLLLTRILR